MPTQQAIRSWFESTYATLGLRYLRPATFYSIFLRYLEASPGDRLLDIGCGPGLLLNRALEGGIESYGVDLSQVALGMVESQAPGAKVGASNAERLCFRDHSFDHITCIGVFEHFLSPEGALAEMRRVLKPSGRLCIMVPNAYCLKWLLEAKILASHDEDSHERAESLGHWRQLFLGAGLQIDSIYRDEWDGYRWRQRLRGSNDLSRYGDEGHRDWHLLPLPLASQFVFLMRP